MVRKVSTWLVDNADPSRARRVLSKTGITRSSWFVRMSTMNCPIGLAARRHSQPANCVACHAGAEQGDFNEHRVRIPR